MRGAWWECVSTSAPHRVLLAGSWLNLLRYHLHLRPLLSTTHTHYLNQQAKLGLWHLCPGPTMRISDCFLPPSHLPRLPAFRSLLSSFLAPIHKYLADIGLAPKLYGYVEVGSAPTAYVMEYLDPSTWQTLYQFDSTKAKVVDPKLRTALNAITKTLESKKMFTGIFEPMSQRNLWTSGSSILTEGGSRTSLPPCRTEYRHPVAWRSRRTN